MEGSADLQVLLRAFGLSLSLDTSPPSISLALPEGIGWSSGEVTKAEALQLRSLRPVQGGLLCEEIFGPMEIADRTRFGHVRLPMPIVPWHLRPLLGALLDEDPGELLEAALQDGGAELRGRLAAMDVGARVTAARGDARRLLEGFAADGQPAARLLWDAIPVIPAYLRVVVPMEDGRLIGPGVNDLYRRTVNRTFRLRRLEELEAPDVIIQNERRMLVEAVNGLYANHLQEEGRRYDDVEGRPMVDLAAMVGERWSWPGLESAADVGARLVELALCGCVGCR